MSGQNQFFNIWPVSWQVFFLIPLPYSMVNSTSTVGLSKGLTLRLPSKEVHLQLTLLILNTTYSTASSSTPHFLTVHIQSENYSQEKDSSLLYLCQLVWSSPSRRQMPFLHGKHYQVTKVVCTDWEIVSILFPHRVQLKTIGFNTCSSEKRGGMGTFGLSEYVKERRQIREESTSMDWVLLSALLNQENCLLPLQLLRTTNDSIIGTTRLLEQQLL